MPFRAGTSNVTWFIWLALLAGLVALCAVCLTTYGARHWARGVQLLTNGLEAARIDTRTSAVLPAHFRSHELAGLPTVVQRYFRAVLREGQPIVSAVTIEMTGNLNMSAKDEQWKSFTSRQRVVTRRPGFLWDARVSMRPGVSVHVLDSYIAGIGLMHASMLGLFTVARVNGEGVIANGEFMRFFAEAMWYPTALLPSQGVRWDPVDAKSANATIVDGPQRATLLFRFNDAALIDSVSADARGSMVGDAVVMMPWECRVSRYAPCDGMTVPSIGEAAWIRPEGRLPYFHGALTSLTYAFASQ